jgi:glutathione S-transferase
MIELYHNKMSVCAQKVRLALAEKGVDWTSHHMSLRDKEHLSQEYLRLNPNGVVPTLVYHGRAIIESTIINEFIDDQFEGVSLRSTDFVQRAYMRYWTKQLDDSIHTATSVVTLSIAVRHQFLESHDEEALQDILQAVPDPKRRASKRTAIEKGVDHPELKVSLLRLSRMLDDMENTLQSSTWLAGPQYTLADIGFLPYVLRLEHLCLHDLMIDPRPNVCRWLDAIRSRKSFEDAIRGQWEDHLYIGSLMDRGAQARDRVLRYLEQS